MWLFSESFAFVSVRLKLWGMKKFILTPVKFSVSSATTCLWFNLARNCGRRLIWRSSELVQSPISPVLWVAETD